MKRMFGRIQHWLLRLFLAIFSALTLDAAPAADRAAERIALDEGARIATYEIAFDEIVLFGGAGSSRPRLTSPAAPIRSLAELSDYLKRIQRENSQKAEVVVYEAEQPRSEATRRILGPKARVQFSRPELADPTVRELGLAGWQRTDSPTQFIVTASNAAELLQKLDALRRHRNVVAAEPLMRRPMRKDLIPSDFYFDRQWSLFNAAPGGVDINVTPAWDETLGRGIVIGINDDGVQLQHPDLSANARADLSYDFVRNAPHSDFALETADTHGTLVGGVAAARGNNGFGVAGVAFQSGLASLRTLSDAGETDDVYARSFAHRPEDIRVVNSSWGPEGWFEGPQPLSAGALKRLAEGGRIFVFAAGNDAAAGRMANYNGFANSPYTIAVGAVGRSGALEIYSERGANVLVVAPAGVITTDRTGELGENPGTDTTPGALPDAYYEPFGGTSAAAPHVAGVTALMLAVNPRLSWRDVQEILIRTARPNTLPGWVTNGAALKFHLGYGAGLVDADAAVRAARTWRRLGKQTMVTVAKASMTNIPDANPAGLVETLTLKARGRVEHVEVTVDLAHPRLSDLEIDVISPSGTVSPLLERGAVWSADTLRWTFMTVWNWGEEAKGDWKVAIRDVTVGNEGQLRNVALNVYMGPSNTPPPPPEFSGELRHPSRDPLAPEPRNPDPAVRSPDTSDRSPNRAPGDATGGSIRSPTRQPENPGIRSPTRRP